MNDSSYTILIPALLLLSVALVGMLYARFVSRSRGNSKEINLVDLDLAVTGISVAVPSAFEFEEDGPERVPFLEPRSEVSPVVEVVSADAKQEEEPKSNETEYFDELQEAAAGLAALMRSSPVGRSEPVVYAPEGLDEVPDRVIKSEDEAHEIFLPLAKSLSEPAEEDSHEDLSGRDPAAPLPLAETLVESTEPDMAGSEIGEIIGNSPLPNDAAEMVGGEPEPEVLSIRVLLGDEVADQFDSLDDGLNELENLVVSIESALSSLNEGLKEVVSGDESEMVYEAA